MAKNTGVTKEATMADEREGSRREALSRAVQQIEKSFG